MTKYRVYIKEIYRGKLSVESYLSEAEIIQRAISLSLPPLKVGVSKIQRLSNHSLGYGAVTLVAQ